MRQKAKSILILLLTALFLLMGCGNKKPEDLSTGTYNACLKVIEAADLYIKMDISYDEFDAKYDEVKRNMEHNSVADTIASSKAQNISTYVFMNYLDSSESIDDIIQTRDSLAEYIGVAKYK